MYQAVGLKTKKVYAEGKYRNDCLRELNKKYPYETRGNKHHVISSDVLPEPMIVRKGWENE